MKELCSPDMTVYACGLSDIISVDNEIIDNAFQYQSGYLLFVSTLDQRLIIGDIFLHLLYSPDL